MYLQCNTEKPQLKLMHVKIDSAQTHGVDSAYDQVQTS